MSRVVRFGLGSLQELPALARELGLERLVLVTSRRARAYAAAIEPVAVYDGVRPHVPAGTVAEAAALVVAADADGLIGLGGGSAIDTCKAVTLRLLEGGHVVSTIAVPTTYAGAEWTPHFGVRDEAARTKSGWSDERLRPVAAIYDPELTLPLPPADSAGTAINALAHCAEALYVRGHNPGADADALRGAELIGGALPRVLADGSDLAARSDLLRGAMHGAFALGDSGLALAHALAQALGARYGLPHGALNAVCLPPALRFNQQAVPEAIERFGRALGDGDPIEGVERLARLGGFTGLAALGVAPGELGEVALTAAARPGARANPRVATPAELEELLHSVL